MSREGDDRSKQIVERWSEAYSWRAAAMDADLIAGRRRLGDALVAAAATPASSVARARLGRALVALQFEEGLERLAGVGELDATLTLLRNLRVEHELEQRALRAANDWSDLDS